MLKEALAGFPTRPVLYLSAMVLVLGLGYHFATTYQKCRSHAVLREALLAAAAASASAGTAVRLAQITGFPWDRAEILVNYKPAGVSTDCPFQWDWSRAVREQLIAADLLTVVVFIRDGKLVNYLEMRDDRVRFSAVENPYTPESAVFRTTRSQAEPDLYLLAPAL